jgi:hypothetical protein
METHMGTSRFDTLTRRISPLLTRRGLASVLGLSAIALPGLATGKKKRHHKRKRKHKKQKRVTFNAFGCVDVGGFCQTDDHCCSGTCTGATGNKTCQAHETSGCQLADDSCAHEESTPCPGDASSATTSGSAHKALRLCFQTTGKAGFCGIRVGNQCVACAKDADCVADFGAGAACVVCPRFCADGNHTTCIPAQL